MSTKSGDAYHAQVNPNHYGLGIIKYDGTPLQVIDIIDSLKLNFNLGNALKYLLRNGRKTTDPLLDLKKLAWYVGHEIAMREAAMYTEKLKEGITVTVGGRDPEHPEHPEHPEPPEHPNAGGVGGAVKYPVWS